MSRARSPLCSSLPQHSLAAGRRQLLGGAISADGSSTVGPFTTRAAEDFRAQGGVDVTVGISGTGGGFERFCAGETDISNASRAIKDEEAAICADKGVEYIELQVATDALTNVVNSRTTGSRA